MEAQFHENLAALDGRLDPELEAAIAAPRLHAQSTYEVLNTARYDPPTAAA